MKILYSHFGREGKDGWGRTFYIAKAMANLGHDVYLLTNSNKKISLILKNKNSHKVNIIIFPDFIPSKLKSSGFGFLSLILKIVFSLFNKFDLVISDCGHRPSSIPCKVNRLIYKSIYISEWWDYFGEEGYYKSKPLLFKIFYGWIEKKAEIRDKLKADGVIVLSELMKKRAEKHGVKNIIKVHGGSLINEINLKYEEWNQKNKINLCYIGINDDELQELKPFSIISSTKSCNSH